MGWPWTFIQGDLNAFNLDQIILALLFCKHPWKRRSFDLKLSARCFSERNWFSDSLLRTCFPGPWGSRLPTSKYLNVKGNMLFGEGFQWASTSCLILPSFMQCKTGQINSQYRLICNKTDKEMCTCGSYPAVLLWASLQLWRHFTEY